MKYDFLYTTKQGLSNLQKFWAKKNNSMLEIASSSSLENLQERCFFNF